MFQIEDYVFYESGGICRIADVQISPLAGMPPECKYYVLQSVGENNGTMYVPVNAKGIFLRKLLSREDAERLIDDIKGIAVFEEPSSKLLRARYIEAMHTHQPREWVRVLKTVHHRVNADPLRPTRISDTERAFGEAAKRYLYTELSIAFDIKESEVEDFIIGRVQKMA